MAKTTDLVMETCLLAGEIMLISGGETYRVEDTMTHIALAAGMSQVHSSVTPTSIILSYCAGGSNITRMIRIMDRSIDLYKVTLVNEVSRNFVSGKCTLEEAYQKLQVISHQKPQYPSWLQHVAAGVASGSFTYLLHGSWEEFVPALFAGILVNSSVYVFQQVLRIKFFAEFMAAFIGGIFVLGSSYLFKQADFGTMLIATMLPLFPGMAVTNSVRDLIAGDLMAGIARGVEALLTAVSVAVAAAIIISFVG